MLAVLAARAITVSDDVRAQILACSDVTTLDRWLRRAATLESAAAVVRVPASTRRAPPALTAAVARSEFTPTALALRYAPPP